MRCHQGNGRKELAKWRIAIVRELIVNARGYQIVRAVTHIKVTRPQYFAVIAHNTEQHGGFGSA